MTALNTAECCLAISLDGAPMNGHVRVTGKDRAIELTFYADLDLGPSHVMSVLFAHEEADKLVDEMLGRM